MHSVWFRIFTVRFPKATGKSFKAPFAHVWKLEGGKAVSFQQYTDTAVHQRPLR